MARLFISYKREDQDVAFAVRQWLIDAQGWSDEDIFVDRDKLRAGDEWAARLFTEAETAQAMLFLASDAALHPESFCYRELRRARGQVLAVTLGSVRPDDERLSRALPYEALARQITSLDQQPARGFEFVSPIDGTRGVVALNRGQVENIGAVLRDLGIAPDSFDWKPDDAGPYPGLPALQEGDEAIFCGRETDIRDGLRALEELRGSVTQKVHLIQAPSGAGKSSFLRAGLWQRLRNHASFTPLVIVRAAQGIISHPEWGLVSQLSAPQANLMGLSKDAIAARVREDLGGFLGELADADAGAIGRRTVLLGIDQGEEITALESTDREEFERLLSEILSVEDLDIRLVLTARDDSVDALIERLEGLGLGAGAIAMNRLNRLSPQRYREIIRGPAEAANRAGWPLEISPELEIALADGASQNRSSVGDALPLLAIALQRMVVRRRRPDGTIDLTPEGAQAFLDDAIADTVNEALKNANADVADLKALLIPQLVTWDPQAGEGGAAKRLVARHDALFAGDRSALNPLADVLVDLRLLTRTSEAKQLYLEVAHEALLRVPPIDELLYATRESYIQAQILGSEAAAWAKSGEREDNLARAGDRLREAQNLLADPLFGTSLAQPSNSIERYLEACEKSNWSKEQAALRLRQQAQINESKLLAAFAKQEFNKRNFGNALGLAFKSLPQNDRDNRPVLLEPIQLLYDTLHQIRELRNLHGHEAPVTGGLELSDGRLLTWSMDCTARLWEADGVEGPVLRGHADPVYGALQLSGGQLLTWSQDCTARLWTVGGAEGPVLRGHKDLIDGARELSDGRLLTWSYDNTARLWDADGSGGPVLRGHEASVNGALELSNGRLLTLDTTHTARLWVADGAEGLVLGAQDERISGALELSDGRLLTWGGDNTARLWTTDGIEGLVLRGHEKWVSGARELSDGRLLTWGGDNTARLWDADGTAGPVLRGHEGPIMGALELSDGRLLTWTGRGVLVGGDNTARLWDADGTAGPVLRGHEDGPSGVRELSDGRLLTWGYDNTARLWAADGAEGPVLVGHEQAVFGASQLSDGRLFTWGGDNTARLWAADEADWPVLRGHKGEVVGALQLSDGQLLTWSRDCTARLWTAGGAEGPVLCGHEGPIMGALELSDGRLLTWSEDGTAQFWGSDGSKGPVLYGHEAAVFAALELSDGRLLTCSSDFKLRLWAADGAEGPVLSGDADRANLGAVRPIGMFGALELSDGRLLTWTWDNTARLWGSDGTKGMALRGHEGPIMGALELSDGMLLTWGGDSVPRLWTTDGIEGLVLRGHEKWVSGARELSDGRLLTWGGDNTARLWDADGTAGPVLRGHEGPIMGALELSDGRLLTWTGRGVLVGGDNTARLWDADGTAGPVLRGHEDGPSGVRELSDGRLLTWGYDNTARLWAADGSGGPVLRGHEASVNGALELSDGRLLTWSQDRTARLWPGTFDALIAWAQSVNDRLTPLSRGELCALNLLPADDW